jgi:phosphonoacetate hydrolase
MQKHAVLICLDGCAPEYLRQGTIPNIRRLGTEGFSIESGRAMVPTVTNVNNVSMITGKYPEEHGITSNCYYDRARGTEVYVESPDFITAPTIFEELAQMGKKCALLSVKDKLCALLNKGPQIVMSAESPPEWIVKEIGKPPTIYSIEVNPWLLKALRVVLEKHNPDFIYIGTTDYVGHKYAPDDEEARKHMAYVDDEIGSLSEYLSGNLLCISADHGMLGKSKAVNLRVALETAGIDSSVIPTVKDKYVVHHSNLSGSAYVYLTGSSHRGEALDILNSVEGVERTLPAAEAAQEYHLPISRVGDYLVLGEEDTVFGEVSEEIISDVKIRSHGSLHERAVPLIVHGDNVEAKWLTENKDLAKVVLDYFERG